MIQEAFISGQLGKALYSDGGQYFVLNLDSPEERIECRPIDFSSFFCFGAEVRSLPNNRLNFADIRNELEAQSHARRALSLLISGMDAALPEDIRFDVIQDAESL